MWDLRPEIAAPYLSTSLAAPSSLLHWSLLVSQTPWFSPGISALPRWSHTVSGFKYHTHAANSQWQLSPKLFSHIQLLLSTAQPLASLTLSLWLYAHRGLQLFQVPWEPCTQAPAQACLCLDCLFPTDPNGLLPTAFRSLLKFSLLPWPILSLSCTFKFSNHLCSLSTY